MVRGIGLLCLTLLCSQQFLLATAVMAKSTPGHDMAPDKNLLRRALMSTDANQAAPIAAAWTLALAGLHVVQAIGEGQLPRDRYLSARPGQPQQPRH